jgi:hypothetical protein
MEGLILVVLVGGLTAAIAIPWAIYARNQRVAAWRSYAEARDLDFLEEGPGNRPEIFGPRRVGDRTDPVQLFLEVRGSGKDQVTYTVAAAGHHLSLPGSLSVTRAGVGTALASLFGGQDIELGNASVDDDLRIRGDHEPSVQQALASPRLQEAIRQVVVDLDEAKVTGTHVEITRRGYELEPEGLDRLLDLAQHGVTLLVEAVRFDPARTGAHVPRPRRVRRPVPPTPAPARVTAPEARPALAPPVDRLIADLAADGTATGQGSFTMDRRAAREKLRAFQLAEPGAWALELVQALIARGATAVHLDADRDDLSLRADGRPFTAEELDNVWSAVLAAGEADDLRARQRLAIGLNALVGLGPKHVEVWSGTVAAGSRLVLGTEGDERVEPAAGPSGLEGTVITTKLGLLDAARNPNAAVKRLVQERAAHAAVPVTVDGEVASDGFRPRALFGLVGLEHDGFRAVGGIDPRPGAAPRLRLQTDGVWIQEWPIASGTPGLTVVIESARFRKDVSQSRIVEDLALNQADALVTVVEEAVLATLAATLGDARGAPGGSVELLRAILRQRLLAYASPADFRPGGDARIVAEAPLLPTRGRGHVSLANLLALRDAGQPVLFADILTTADVRTFDAAVPCLDLDRLQDPAERALLVHLFGNVLRHVD